MENISPTSPIWGIACLITGCITAYLLRNIPHSECFHTGRHRNMDGLRGVLALIMFICHASTWQQYLIDGKWRISHSPIYILPGQTGIVIFFMLTGFLFTKKFLTSKSTPENWIKIYTSRFTRLVPAYTLMLFGLFSVVFLQIFNGNAHWLDCRLSDAIAWLTFTIPGAPNLCGYSATNIAVAGVTWSLTYEWAFYFSLPLLAKITGKHVHNTVLLLSTTALIIFIKTIPFYPFVYFCFLMGAASAILDHKKPSTWLQNTPQAGTLALALLITNSLINTDTSYKISSALIIFLAFHIFASGNSLFGILNTRTFQVFGIITYSLYLFHGLLLYATLSYLISKLPILPYKDHFYWTTIISITPLLIGVSLFSYLKIEHPPMLMTSKISKSIEKKINTFRRT